MRYLIIQSFYSEEVFRNNAISNGWENSLTDIETDSSLIESQQNKVFKLSEIQAQAILDMRLQRLTGLERKKIEDEYLEIIKLIAQLRSILESNSKRMQIIKEELLQIKEKYNDDRQTEIIKNV